MATLGNRREESSSTGFCSMIEVRTKGWFTVCAKMETISEGTVAEIPVPKP
eukprot:CAMPEP_0175484036 /NCGR_PEP_ID=MMETSP0095-20121207/79789_1 /TAXON_ID=311494 /ORGANISM="Alexandrium monilatum, Strain CCMP3105" /LENGTH=50 /DNA_ID=CAMNT_0016785749 /DNA_START=79 /DNA_END=227 /DNA_ORIENTATION=-